jgi:PPOX class probable F420-dependent enzyme
MDVPESHRDLLDAQVATLATIDDDRFPQLTVVWFLWDDEVLRISLATGRYKTRNLERRPECSVLVLDPQNPYRYLEIRGRARLEPDDGSFLAKVGEKYGTNPSAYDQPGDRRLVVTVDPVRIHAVAMG